MPCGTHSNVSKSGMLSMNTNLSLQHKALLLNLYASQFIGMGFFLESLIAILRKNGVALEYLGLIYSLGLFMVLRFLWAPLIDKIRFKKFGHYKTWLLIWQSLMIVSLIFVSFYNVLNELPFILIGCLFFAFFVASQDIALDALAYKIASEEDRGMVNALKIGGGMIGTFIGGGVVLIVYEHLDWFYSILILSLATATSLLQLFFFKEPKDTHQNSFHEPRWKDFFLFWRGKKKQKWLVLLLVYPICISSAYGLVSPILVDAGWRLDHIGLYINIVGMGLGTLGAFGAGWLIKKFGRESILIWTPVVQGFGVLFLLFPVLGYTSMGFGIFAIGLVMFLYSPSSTVISTLMMDHVEHSPALEYSMQHCVFSFAGIFSAGIMMSLSGTFGYFNVILTVSLIAVGSTIFAWFVSSDVTIKNDENIHLEVIG